jgi:hypothetical protein
MVPGKVGSAGLGNASASCLERPPLLRGLAAISEEKLKAKDAFVVWLRNSRLSIVDLQSLIIATVGTAPLRRDREIGDSLPFAAKSLA